MTTYAANAKGKAHGKMALADGKEAADAAYPAEERKIEAVSTASYWAFHGGVAAMCAEAAKCEPLCRMCHRLDPSSSSAPENATTWGAACCGRGGCCGVRRGVSRRAAACRGVPHVPRGAAACRGVPRRAACAWRRSRRPDCAS